MDERIGALALQRCLRRVIVARGALSRTVQIEDHPIHYYEVGQRAVRTPLLLVHGLGGSGAGFVKILFPLARRFGRVLAPDLPGHGFSPTPGSGALKLNGHLQVLASFCQRVVGQSAFVIGNSLGGALCVTLAHQFPNCVRALGLLAPAGAPMEQNQIDDLSRAMRVKNGAQVRALTKRLFHRPPWLALWFSPLLRALYDTPAVRAIFSEVDPSLFLEPKVLQELKIPILLIWGEGEKLLPFSGVDYFRAHLPKSARVEVVKGFGHVPHIERPKELIRRLTEFASEFSL